MGWMGFLSAFGKVVIVLSVIGFSVGLYESSVLGNVIVAALAFFGLVGGIYVGTLGIRVDELDAGNHSDYDQYSKASQLETRLDELTKRIQRLEPVMESAETQGELTNSNRLEVESRKDFLRAVGYTEAEIAEIKDLPRLTNEQFGALMHRKSSRQVGQ